MPDGSTNLEDNFYDDGHEISMDAPRQNGWDYIQVLPGVAYGRWVGGARPHGLVNG